MHVLHLRAHRGATHRPSGKARPSDSTKFVLARESRKPGIDLGVLHGLHIQSLRGGDSPGEHSVLFVGQGERLEQHHRSHTRDHYARGAVHAARWLVGREPGLYRIEQVLGLED